MKTVGAGGGARSRNKEENEEYGNQGIGFDGSKAFNNKKLNNALERYRKHKWFVENMLKKFDFDATYILTWN